MIETGPLPAQIAAEWITINPADDSVRWWEGMSLYEAGSLDDGAAMEEAAQLMCAALALVFHEAWLLSGAPKRKNAPELG